MTLSQFIDKWLNKAADFDGAYGSQCVDLFRFYNKEVLEIPQPRSVAGAKDFWTNYDSDLNLKNNFTKIPNTPTGVPQYGDVMIWGSTYGQFGHIAIFLEGNVNSFVCFSQNDPVGKLSIKKYYSNYNGVLGWFRPKKTVSEPSHPPESNTMLAYLGVPTEAEAKIKLKEHLGELNGKCNWGGNPGGHLGSERAKNAKLQGENADLSAKVSDYATKVTTLEAKIKELSQGQVPSVPPSSEFDEAKKLLSGMSANGARHETRSDGTQKIEISYKLKE
jgi:hypothetical protein